MAFSSFKKVYDEHGTQLSPTDPNDPMFSDLYCQEFIIDCDRVITIQFYEHRRDNYISPYTGRHVMPITIRIDTAYNNINAIHDVLTQHFKPLPTDNIPHG